MNTRIKTLLSVITVSTFVSGCARAPELSQQLVDTRLNNPQTRFQLILDSSPSGADVYAYNNGTAGKYLGQTPLEFLLTTVEYYAPLGSATNWFGYGMDAFLFTNESVRFSCLIRKEGYKPEIIDKTLISEPFGTAMFTFNDTFEGKNMNISSILKTYNDAIQQEQIDLLRTQNDLLIKQREDEEFDRAARFLGGVLHLNRAR